MLRLDIVYDNQMRQFQEEMENLNKDKKVLLDLQNTFDERINGISQQKRNCISEIESQKQKASKNLENACSEKIVCLMSKK